MEKKHKKVALTPEVMPKAGALVKRSKLPVAEITVEERIKVIRNNLDMMENVQLAFAAGAVQIGMEVLALKAQTPYGQFETLFHEQLERPRFTWRTAQKYMRAAEQVRVKLLKSGSQEIAESFDVPPSAMTLAKRRKLQDVLSEVLNGKTLSDLLMGDRQVTGGGPGGRAPSTGAEAQLEAHVQIYQALRKQITREILVSKNWKHLPAREIADLRTVLEQAANELPVKI